MVQNLRFLWFSATFLSEVDWSTGHPEIKKKYEGEQQTSTLQNFEKIVKILNSPQFEMTF